MNEAMAMIRAGRQNQRQGQGQDQGQGHSKAYYIMALELLKNGVGDENSLSLFYRGLLDETSTAVDEEKSIIRQLYFDSVKHEKLFQSIYESQTGSNTYDIGEKIQRAALLRENYKTALFKEIEQIEFYRQIYFAFSDIQIRDKLFEIITDKQIHIAKLNYLLMS